MEELFGPVFAFEGEISGVSMYCRLSWDASDGIESDDEEDALFDFDALPGRLSLRLAFANLPRWFGFGRFSTPPPSLTLSGIIAKSLEGLARLLEVDSLAELEGMGCCDARHPSCLTPSSHMSSGFLSAVESESVKY